MLEEILELLQKMTTEQLNILSVGISAGAGLLGAVIGAGATLLTACLTRKMQMSGKVTLHVKNVYTKDSLHHGCGYYRFQGRTELFMTVPLLMDVCNTSGVSRVVRDVNLHAYYRRQEIAEFVPMQGMKTTPTKSGREEKSQEKEILFGDEGSSTLVVPANSARRFYMEFVLGESNLSNDNKKFDEVVLTYFDEQDNIHAFHLRSIDRCWIEGPLDMPRQWITMDRRCKYAR